MMMTGLHTRTLTASPLLQATGHASSALEDRTGAGLLQVWGDPYERKCAAKVALVFFVASLVLAPALERDQKKLAAEINNKTLKAAAAIKSTARVPLHVQN
jgi:hypothetical protein